MMGLRSLEAGLKAGFGLVGAAAFCGAPAPARAQDAHVLLDRTIQTYQKLGSYQGKGIVEVNNVAGGVRQIALAISTDMAYRRPNKLALKIESRSANLQVLSDGGKLTIYKEEGQTYSNGPSAPTLEGILPLLQSRAGIGGMLDPLFFLSHAALPGGLAGLKTLPPAKVNGRDVVVVTGTWEGSPPPDQLHNVFCAKGARWTLYLDKSNGLLQKVEARVGRKFAVRAKRNGKVQNVAVDGEIVMNNTIVDARPNAPLDDKAFVFTPPKGATEQKDVNELLRGGHAR